MSLADVRYLIPLSYSLLSLCVPGRAQEPDPAQLLKRIKELGIAVRSGDVPVYYSACCEREAIEAQEAFIGSNRFYERNLGVRVGLTGFLLTQDDFDRLAAPRRIPFSGAFVTDRRPHLAFVPLGEQSIVNRLYLPKRNSVPTATLKLLDQAKVSYPEAIRQFMIHLVLHEIGHIQVREYGIPIADGWFTEFLANYFSYTYSRAEKPKLALVVEALNQVPLESVLHTSLDEYETLTVNPSAPTDSKNIGLDNNVWYQQKFERQAIRVHGECGGIDFIKRIKSGLPSSPSGATGQPKIPLAELLPRLEHLCPGFESWAAGLRNASIK